MAQFWRKRAAHSRTALLQAIMASNWRAASGNNNTNGVSAEEDLVGHVTVTSATSNNVTGAMDFSELTANQEHSTIQP